MKNKKFNKNAHSVGSALMVVVLIMSIFAFGLYTGNNSLANNPNNQITAAAVGMEKVTGFAAISPDSDAKIFQLGINWYSTYIGSDSNIKVIKSQNNGETWDEGTTYNSLDEIRKSPGSKIITNDPAFKSAQKIKESGVEYIWGTDEKAIMEEIKGKTAEQKEEIANAYLYLTDRTLEEDMKREFNVGEFAAFQAEFDKAVPTPAPTPAPAAPPAPAPAPSPAAEPAPATPVEPADLNKFPGVYETAGGYGYDFGDGSHTTAYPIDSGGKIVGFQYEDGGNWYYFNPKGEFFAWNGDTLEYDRYDPSAAAVQAAPVASPPAPAAAPAAEPTPATIPPGDPNQFPGISKITGANGGVILYQLSLPGGIVVPAHPVYSGSKITGFKYKQYGEEKILYAGAAPEPPAPAPTATDIQYKELTNFPDVYQTGQGYFLFLGEGGYVKAEPVSLFSGSGIIGFTYTGIDGKEYYLGPEGKFSVIPAPASAAAEPAPVASADSAPSTPSALSVQPGYLSKFPGVYKTAGGYEYDFNDGSHAKVYPIYSEGQVVGFQYKGFDGKFYSFNSQGQFFVWGEEDGGSYVPTRQFVPDTGAIIPPSSPAPADPAPEASMSLEEQSALQSEKFYQDAMERVFEIYRREKSSIVQAEIKKDTADNVYMIAYALEQENFEQSKVSTLYWNVASLYADTAKAFEDKNNLQMSSQEKILARIAYLHAGDADRASQQAEWKTLSDGSYECINNAGCWDNDKIYKKGDIYGATLASPEPAAVAAVAEAAPAPSPAGQGVIRVEIEIKKDEIKVYSPDGIESLDLKREVAYRLDVKEIRNALGTEGIQKLAGDNDIRVKRGVAYNLKIEDVRNALGRERIQKLAGDKDVYVRMGVAYNLKIEEVRNAVPDGIIIDFINDEKLKDYVSSTLYNIDRNQITLRYPSSGAEIKYDLSSKAFLGYEKVPQLPNELKDKFIFDGDNGYVPNKDTETDITNIYVNLDGSVVVDVEGKGSPKTFKSSDELMGDESVKAMGIIPRPRSLGTPPATAPPPAPAAAPVAPQPITAQPAVPQPTPIVQLTENELNGAVNKLKANAGKLIENLGNPNIESAFYDGSNNLVFVLDDFNVKDLGNNQYEVIPTEPWEVGSSIYNKGGELLQYFDYSAGSMADVKTLDPPPTSQLDKISYLSDEGWLFEKNYETATAYTSFDKKYRVIVYAKENQPNTFDVVEINTGKRLAADIPVREQESIQAPTSPAPVPVSAPAPATPPVTEPAATAATPTPPAAIDTTPLDIDKFREELRKIESENPDTEANDNSPLGVRLNALIREAQRNKIITEQMANEFINGKGWIGLLLDVPDVDQIKEKVERTAILSSPPPGSGTTTPKDETTAAAPPPAPAAAPAAAPAPAPAPAPPPAAPVASVLPPGVEQTGGKYNIEVDPGVKVEAKPKYDDVNGDLIGFYYEFNKEEYYVTQEGNYYKYEANGYVNIGHSVPAAPAAAAPPPAPPPAPAPATAPAAPATPAPPSGKTSIPTKIQDLEKELGLASSSTVELGEKLKKLNAEAAFNKAELEYKDALSRAVEAKKKAEILDKEADKLQAEGKLKEAQAKLEDAKKAIEDQRKYTNLAIKNKNNLERAEKVFADVSYDANKAYSDLNGKADERDKANLYLENLVNNPKTSPEKREEVLQELKRSDYNDNAFAQKLIKDIESDKQKEEQAKNFKELTGKEVTYDRATNKFVFQGQKGDLIAIKNGNVILSNLPKTAAEQATVDDKKTASTQFLERIKEFDDSLAKDLSIDTESGNVRDSNGNWVVGVEQDKDGKFKLTKVPPEYIVINKQKIPRYKDFTFEGTGIYKDPKTGILYDQKSQREIKDKEVTIVELDGLLKKSLKTDSAGKLTTETANSLVKAQDGTYRDVDTKTYDIIKATKGEGIKPEYESNTLTIKIKDTTYSFVGYKTVSGKADGLTRIVKEAAIFTDRDGKTYSTEEVGKMDAKKKEELGISEKEERIIIADRAEVFESGKTATILTTSYSTYEKKQIAETLSTTKGIVTYYYAEKDGQRVEVVLNADGTLNTGVMRDAIVYKYTNVNLLTTETKAVCLTNNCNPESDARSNTRQNQITSRSFFAQLESILTDFSGLGYYATLFFDDEDLDAWRENVDKAFATLYLGTEYWTSDICAAYEDIDRSSQGVAYVDTKTGLAAVAAHIEASRSEQILGVGAADSKTGMAKPTREFLYKITFNVKNGDYESDPKAMEKMSFNVVLKGERDAKLFKADIEVSKGDQFGHIGKNAIVQYSGFSYNKICIDFKNTPSSWNLGDDELCNTIIGPSGATSVGRSQQPAQQETAGEGNVNDI